VKLQEWVKHKGLKVCNLFEGCDGAGKGGTLKALTERVMGFAKQAEVEKFLKAAPLFRTDQELAGADRALTRGSSRLDWSDALCNRVSLRSSARDNIPCHAKKILDEFPFPLMD
jgi:hypothetical protein